ncbi:MAG: hypothetical protein FWF79_07920 [Defluviitaleaceae bacterium]|nr:hypothetical protein [Defluviitaleaceae bacterium]
MNKRELLESLRRENARERGETRENEMYTREGEDFRIEGIRDKMARTLTDPDIDAESRKKRLATFKEEIDTILDERDEREHAFIEQELIRHKTEQELEDEITGEEEKSIEKPNEQTESLRQLLRAHPALTAGAEQKRKEIEENRIDLSEEEQFSTILINNSALDKIPQFKPVRRRKKKEEPEQSARIDTIVLKQREIGIMYRESQELQESQLKKAKKPPATPDDLDIAPPNNS